MSKRGFVVLENGDCFSGKFLGGNPKAGEFVFNTSHNGYEEVATDPSYYGQIMVMTAPQQGNYGVDKSFWESSQLWINGFIALQVQNFPEDSHWLKRLTEEFKIPVLSEVDTRQLVLKLRNSGTQVGAIVQAETESQAKELSLKLIAAHKALPTDWVYAVSNKKVESLLGSKSSGPRVAVLDFGCKQNILRELTKRCREVKIFPSRTSAREILDWNPDGILLSNGPGDPKDVQEAVENIKQLIGKKTIFGICMGHQLLGLALGGKTYKLKFGHRGANHPVKDLTNNQITVTSQNHGYAVDAKTLPESVKITHVNLNDGTVSGIEYKSKNCFSVQFHPENHPGPRDADTLFDRFMEWIENGL